MGVDLTPSLQLHQAPEQLVLLNHSSAHLPLSSRHLWILNVCRASCGFCQGLAPVWYSLARRLRQEAFVAYWEAEEHGRPPSTLGEFHATPAIRAFVPRPLSDPPVQIINYEGDRTSADLARFVRSLLPDFVVRIANEEDWLRIHQRAVKDRKPRLLLFTTRPAAAESPPILKAISSEFEGHVLVSEVHTNETIDGVSTFTSSALFSMPPKLPAACIIPSVDYRMSCIDSAPTYSRLSALAMDALAMAHNSNIPSSTGLEGDTVLRREL
ncbi:MAG: hypothetical protein SGPRY_002689 [Prymnesium sp.]